MARVIKSKRFKHLIPNGYRRARLGEKLPRGYYQFIEDGDLITRNTGIGARLSQGYENMIFLIKKS